MRILLTIGLVASGLAASEPAASGASPPPPSAVAREDPFVTRHFVPLLGDEWIGNAIAYGPYRDGQFPGGPSPSKQQLREDLLLLIQDWNLLRLYDSGNVSELILEIIQEESLDMKVMLGVWIGVEYRLGEEGEILEAFPETRAANQLQVERAIQLAHAYPDIVIAVNVGNETQVFWSGHRVPTELLIGYVREVRAGIPVPVTVADDFNYWNKPESRDIAQEIDFIVFHAHPLWNGILIEGALDWTKKRLEEVRALHPGHKVVLGETGWATSKHDVGEQAELIKGKPGEAQQKIFFDAVTAWAEEDRVTVFFFEAFDESWKGGEHPDEVEKHWGLYRADRTPKEAMTGE